MFSGAAYFQSSKELKKITSSVQIVVGMDTHQRYVDAAFALDAGAEAIPLQTVLPHQL
jgi:hypothetical protein